MTDQAAFKQQLQTWRKAINERMLDSGFEGEPAYMNAPARYALENEGKRLRPALCFAAAEAVGGDWQRCLPAAVALEIFHTFTLVHDDIMDADDLRRGKATVHVAFDVNRAILSGDVLFVKAYEYLARLEDTLLGPALRMFNTAAVDLCRGQAWDMQFEASETVSLRDYEIMIDAKTGALVKLSCGLGALVGGGTTEQIEQLSRFGLFLGRAFQLQDDLLEVTSSAEVMGKSLGSDILNDKKTWLWLDLMEQLGTDGMARLRETLGSSQSPEAKLETIRGQMFTRGTIERAQRQISAWMREAGECLDRVTDRSDTALHQLAELILARQN